MSFYGVEWDLTVDAYQFDVGYDRDAPCGLNQRTVYVCERIPIQRVPLESVSGRWLLDAYLGADRDTRQRAYASAVAQVESDSAVALVALAPDAPLLSKKTGRHRRRMQRRALEPRVQPTPAAFGAGARARTWRAVLRAVRSATLAGACHAQRPPPLSALVLLC
jgi:hypothetical protein